ncbi:MAG: AAA domain-containing protein [Candidatus Hydrogenedens sp.]|nr:AAA domain-containing protein [Candidatus Hydrogenedens sp.]
MSDDYRQLDPYITGASLGNFSSSTDEHINDCIARIETLKLKVLGNLHIAGFERSEFLAELNTLRAAYLHLCTLASRPQLLDPGGRPVEEASRPGLALEGVIGSNPQISENLDRIARVAPSRLTVLLEGETGSGKELFARIIHLNSRRTTFVPVNCGALPSGVIESELFGHVKGAFTGATSDRKGRFEEADGGTIFLDEIGELEPLAQVKLLRTLDVGEIQRVGSDKVQKVDVRVIAATNRTLEAMVADGKFREDLYFRLNICHFLIPPLRERRDEISLLLDFFIKKICADARLPVPALDRRLHDFLVARYHFPGNIRELKNLAQYIAYIYNHTPVTLEDLPRRYFEGWRKAAAAGRPAAPPPDPVHSRLPGAAPGLGAGSFKDVRDRAEREELLAVLIRHRGDVKAVCAESGLSRARLYQLFKKYDLRPGQYR